MYHNYLSGEKKKTKVQNGQAGFFVFLGGMEGGGTGYTCLPFRQFIAAVMCSGLSKCKMCVFSSC